MINPHDKERERVAWEQLGCLAIILVLAVLFGSLVFMTVRDALDPPVQWQQVNERQRQIGECEVDWQLKGKSRREARRLCERGQHP